LGKYWVLVTYQTLDASFASNLRTLRSAVGQKPDPHTFALLDRLPAQEVTIRKLRNDFGLGDGEALRAILAGSLSVDLTAGRLGPRTQATPVKSSFKHMEVLPLWHSIHVRRCCAPVNYDRHPPGLCVSIYLRWVRGNGLSLKVDAPTLLYEQGPETRQHSVSKINVTSMSVGLSEKVAI